MTETQKEWDCSFKIDERTKLQDIIGFSYDKFYCIKFYYNSYLMSTPVS